MKMGTTLSRHNGKSVTFLIDVIIMDKAEQQGWGLGERPEI